ncbi:MAG: OadG family protein [Deltaproteobacteria bacterium]|nr:OadG family protein [Deltaproteobacteria bacterium]
MYGLEAISANHGWEYAALGISIVFIGLILLSFAISQLHKMLAVWDNRKNWFQTPQQETETEIPDIDQDGQAPVFTCDIKESARQVKLLVDWVGEPFALPKLLELAGKSGLTRPHAIINDLIIAGHILPEGTGYYIWKQKSEK